MQKNKVLIQGMHCESCAIRIEQALNAIEGIEQVSVNREKGEAIIGFNGPAPTYEQIEKAICDVGYSIGSAEDVPWISKRAKDYTHLLIGGVILGALYLIARMTGLLDLRLDTTGENIWVALLVGLTAGVSSCMALIGGLTLGFSARHAELHPEATPLQNFRPHLFFNAGRLLGYALLGGFIGLIGSVISISTTILNLMAFAVGIVMVFLGLKLIDIFPILKNKTITLPKALSNVLGLRDSDKEYSHSGAFIAGSLTFFLPCGFTQAMQLYAVSTGDFGKGALVMFLFAVGTTPGLLGIGWLSSVFKGLRARIFFATAGLVVIVMGSITIANALPPLPSLTQQHPAVTESILNGGAQEVRMTQGPNGYSPNQFILKKGVPVRWIVDSTSQYSCANYLVMSDYDVRQTLKPGENVIEFTPTEDGKIPFACSMGMYRGTFIVQ